MRYTKYIKVNIQATLENPQTESIAIDWFTGIRQYEDVLYLTYVENTELEPIDIKIFIETIDNPHLENYVLQGAYNIKGVWYNIYCYPTEREI